MLWLHVLAVSENLFCLMLIFLYYTVQGVMDSLFVLCNAETPENISFISIPYLRYWTFTCIQIDLDIVKCLKPARKNARNNINSGPEVVYRGAEQVDRHTVLDKPFSCIFKTYVCDQLRHRGERKN